MPILHLNVNPMASDRGRAGAFFTFWKCRAVSVLKIA